MHVDVTPRRLEVFPDMPQRISVTIVNTETIIGGYALRVLGADPDWVELPSEDTISLFPDETRNLTVVVTVPRGVPAGSRRVAIQVVELTPPEASSVVEVDLVVPPEPRTRVEVDPIAVTAGKRAAFTVIVENGGNTQVVGFLGGDDSERQVAFTFEPDRVSLAPGQHTIVDMRASAKRRLFGNPTVRTLGIHLDENPEDAFFDDRFATAPEPRARDEGKRLAAATFIQKSVMSRSFLSLIGLLFAATVFAIVIVIALSKLVGQSTADRNLALQVAQARNQTATTGTSGVSGTVTLLTSGKPVPGVAVSVFAISDTSSPVATTATDARGGFAVTDLVAGKYKVSFRGAGFVEIWYPAASTDADATTITLAGGQVQGGLNVSLGGTPSTISGNVVGDDVSAATLFLMTLPPSGTTVQSNQSTLQPQDPTPGVVTPPDNGGAVVQRVPIGSDGSFQLTNVPSPSVYDLVVVKTGYATSTQRIDIGAGEHRTGVQITLSKGDGLISGTITSATGALGGVTVTATSGQSTVNTVSLTGASAGQFTLRSLPTPATFTVVASRAGFASQTLSLSLASGQKLTGVAITLNQSSGALNGVVTLLPGNSRVGGVGVTVSNGVTTVQTATDSSNNVGAWHVGGLPVPSTYTVTFSRSDLESQTVSVTLDAAGNVTPGSAGTRLTTEGIAVSMESATAVVTGVITQTGTTHCAGGGGGLGEASVSLSSGSSTFSVTSASVAPNCGKYRLESIPPGTYTLTVAAGSGTSPSSKVITVTAGQTSTQNVNLSLPASLSGVVAHCPTASCPGGAGLQARGGWSVFLYLQTDYPFTVTATTTTNANGSFAFNNIAAGNYILAAGPTTDPSNATNTVPKLIHPSTNETITVLVSQ